MGPGGSIRLLRDYARVSRDTTAREADTADDAGACRGGSAREESSSGFVRDVEKLGRDRIDLNTSRFVVTSHVNSTG